MGGIALSNWTGPQEHPAGLLAGALVVTAAVAVLVSRRFPAISRHVATVVLALLAGAAGYQRHQVAITLPAQHVAYMLDAEPMLTRIVGEISTTPVTQAAEKHNPYLPYQPPPRTRFVLAAHALCTTEPATPTCGYVRVTVETDALAAGLGDVVELTGKLYRPRGPRNPGEPDWPQAQRLQGIHAGLSVEGNELVRKLAREGALHRRALARIRGCVRSVLFEPYAHVEADPATRLLDALVLGQRSAPTRALNEAFVRTGAVHFLAVSGFHVGVLAWVVWMFVRRVLRRAATPAALATTIVLIIYAIVAEHNAPILRAVTMGVLACLALLLRRPLCVINWLALATLCVLTVNPLELFRPGFQLSFLQVLVLLTLVPATFRMLMRRRADEPPTEAETLHALVWQKAGHWLAGLAMVCLVAWATSLPLVMYHFGRFSAWGWLFCMLLSPLVIITIVLGFVTIITAPAGPLATAVGHLLRWSTGGLLATVDRLAQVPGTLVEVRQPPLWLVALSYAALAWLVYFARRTHSEADIAASPSRPRRKVLVLVLLPALVVTGWLGWYHAPRPQDKACTLHVLAVGSGSASVLVTPDHTAAVFDAGTMGNWDVGLATARALDALRVRRLETVTISHANFDHFSGVHTLLERYTPGSLCTNPYLPSERAQKQSARQFFALLPPGTPPPEALRAGDERELGAALIEVLWPPDGIDDWEANDRSLVLRVRAFGRTILIPGDIERAGLRGLLAAERDGRVVLKSDVLIAPHHGSVIKRDTAAFYAAVAPEVVVVSTSKPRPKLAELLSETLPPTCRLVSTREAGAVAIRITRTGELRAETPYAQADE